MRKGTNTRAYLRRIAATAALLLTALAVHAQNSTCPKCGREGKTIESTPATCLGEGMVELVCPKCGYSWLVYPPPLGHDWSGWAQIAATCTTGGYDQHTCNRCGATERKNETSPLGHDYGADRICLRCGETCGPVSYIGADGQTAECTDYTFIVGEGSMTLGTAKHNTWYAVHGNVSLSDLLFKDNTANIILLDGATLSITATGQTYAINAWNTLNIFGQEGGTGRLIINSADNAIYAKTAVNIYGGDISATSTNTYGISSLGNIGIFGGKVNAESTQHGHGIFAILGSVTIAGGRVNATCADADKSGIYGDGGISLGWTSTSSITASSYGVSNGSSVTLAKGFLGSDGNFYAPGVLDDASVLGGKTLTGADLLYDNAANDLGSLAKTTVALYGRTIYRDGEWNTLCLPFALPTLAGTPLEGFTVMELDEEASNLTGDVLTLNFKDASAIKAGKPYIVKKLQMNGSLTSPTLQLVGGTSYNGKPASNLVDGKTNTYWEGVNGAYCEFRTETPVYVTGYTLTTASSGNIPDGWQLHAKAGEGDEWKSIDAFSSVTSPGEGLSGYGVGKSYSVHRPGHYQYFRFVLYGSSDNDAYSLAELSLQGYEPDPDNHLVNPLFQGVTITSTTPARATSSDGTVTFVGQYDPIEVTEPYRYIMLGSNNTMGYAATGNTLRPFRAHFEIASDQPVKACNISFGEGAETSIQNSKFINSKFKIDDAWYSIDGRKLPGKPTKKGIYIHNGNKVAL